MAKENKENLSFPLVVSQEYHFFEVHWCWLQFHHRHPLSSSALSGLSAIRFWRGSRWGCDAEFTCMLIATVFPTETPDGIRWVNKQQLFFCVYKGLRFCVLPSFTLNSGHCQCFWGSSTIPTSQMASEITVSFSVHIYVYIFIYICIYTLDYTTQLILGL